MNKNYPFSEIQEKLASVQKLAVALPQNPRYDQVAAALSLSMSLSRMGKNPLVVCPSPMTVEFNNLVGVDKISQRVKGTDLVVSLDYSMDDVEKISYNDDDGKLNLVIQPKAGAVSINENSVSVGYSGAGADLVFTVGIKDMSQLESSGLGLINPEGIINIDNRSDNTNFGYVNVIDIDACGLSEIVFGLLSGLGLSLEVDACQNILNGLWQSTQGLRKADLGADTYEAVAYCLRLGAVKPKEAVFTKPMGTKPVENLMPKQKTWTGREENRPVPPRQQTPPKSPPADWFEPKIYRGTNNI